MVAAVLACAACLSYRNSLSIPFLFDDVPAIVENPSIRDLREIGEVLLPDLEGGVTTSGRPVLNLSFAINRAIGGDDVRGYHALNLAIHYLSALLLFGVVRRAFLLRPSSKATGLSASAMAAAVAGLWMLHPLQTSAVTYLAQRAESLCGLFYLATLYTFVRATESTRPRWWFAGSIAACALGMGTKEVMVSAPLLVLLFDRTFVAGTFAEAWRCRKAYYGALAGTWIVLVVFAFETSGRGTTAGFETVVTPWSYLLTQCAAIVHYIRLAVWPHPLVFDYGTATVASLASVWWQAAMLAGLAGGSVWALVKRPVLGFWAVWFFAILAPSSSVVPVASQTVAEHRMYLPLAAIVVLGVSAAGRWLRRPVSFGVFAAGLAVGSGLLTAARNGDYKSGRTIWEDTAAKMPGNPRARINLALALSSAGDYAEALGQLDLALKADPSSADAHYNRGVLLSKLGRKAEAGFAYQAAIRFYPNHAQALNNLGNLAHESGDLAKAEDFFRRAIASRAGYSDALGNLSAVLLDAGRTDESLLQAEAALRANPSSAEAAFRVGNALLGKGRAREAMSTFEKAVELNPAHADAHNNLGNLFVEFDQLGPALFHYQQAIALRPGMIPPRRNAAIILAHLGRNAEAIAQLEALTRLAPEDPVYREQLARLRQQAP